MRKNIGYSLIIHAAVLALGYFGLPSMRPDVAPVDVPITVEIVTVADKTNVAKPQPKKAKPKAKLKAKLKAKPKPEQKKVAALPPPPAKPKPGKAAVQPSPQSRPKAKLKHKPEPEAKKNKAPPPLAKARPRHKPRPPDTFASVLKTLEKLKERQQVEKKKKKKENSFEKMMAKALIFSKRQGDLSKPITISEIDLVRQQIARCWNLPAGAKDAEDLIIEIKVFMNPDGTVNTADIKDKKRLSRDGFYRSAAESALRAVLNRRCQPFKLPPEKYNRWKTMTLVFNPKDMF
ncbi:MAG TPA: hypothetical protein ENI55_02080 [Alphaproteobacteria bacterium]|nr:hypothetical protein [Alphaproteobacteria bacterium]